MHQLSYRTGASQCRYHPFSIGNHPASFVGKPPWHVGNPHDCRQMEPWKMISTATYCNPHLAGCWCWTLGCWLGCHITKYLNITPVGLENPRLTLNISKLQIISKNKPALGDIQHNCCRCWHVGNHPRRCPWCPRASHWELHDFGSILVHLKSPKKWKLHDVTNMC